MARKYPAHWLSLSLGVALFVSGTAVGDEEPPLTLVPAPTQSAAGDGASSRALGKGELVQERYKDGAIKVERYVIQDAEGNFLNHGPWTWYDERGNVLARGEFVHGQRQGVWTRIHQPLKSEMYSRPPYTAFVPPFVSEATFEDGELHGLWTVYDAHSRKASEFQFEHGEQHGVSVWYHPSGQKFREANFDHGKLEGELMEWNGQNQLTGRAVFKQGREVQRKVTRYKNGQVETDAVYLMAPIKAETAYDWWNGVISFQPTGKQATGKKEKDGEDQRHGAWVAWYPNGQKKLEGRYESDQPVGRFVWWYENGQKAIEGEYVDGRQMGDWVWWHPNGLKALEGRYQSGMETGKWTWWNADGQVANSMEFTVEESAVATATPQIMIPRSMPVLQQATSNNRQAPGVRMPRPSRLPR